MYEFTIKAGDLKRMRELCHKEKVVCFIDGACIGNPGPAGCSAIFFAERKVHDHAYADSDSEKEQDNY